MYTMGMANSTKSATKAASQTPDIAALSAALMGKTAKPTLSTAPAEKQVASRATWTGVLTFGLVTMGVKTFKAADAETVSFNRVYLTNPDEVAKGAKAIYAKAKNGESVDVEGKALPKESILSGYEYADGEFVIVSKEEKAACMVTSDKKLEILSFTKSGEVDPIYFATAEYMAPEKGFEKPFALLRAGMVARGVVAVAKVSARGREETVILRPYGEDGIVAQYMYFDNEIRSFEKWTKVNLNAQETEIAGMLIDALTDEFDPTQYSDSYTRTLKGLVNDKIQGNAIALPAPAPAPVADAKVDIMSQLMASMNTPAVTAKKAKKAAAVA